MRKLFSALFLLVGLDAFAQVPTSVSNNPTNAWYVNLGAQTFNWRLSTNPATPWAALKAPSAFGNTWLQLGNADAAGSLLGLPAIESAVASVASDLVAATSNSLARIDATDVNVSALAECVGTLELRWAMNVGGIPSGISSFASFGDSITYGVGSSSPSGGYVSRLGTLLGTTNYANYGQSGFRAGDIASYIFQNTNAGPYTLMVGANDQAHNTSSSARDIAYKAILNAQILRLSLPESYKLYGRTVSYNQVGVSGTWTTSSNTANCATFAKGVNSSNGSITSTNAGRTVVVSVMSGSKFEVSIDGEYVGAFNTTLADLGYANYNANIKAYAVPMSFVFSGLDPKPHTVVVTAQGGTLFYEYSAGIDYAPDATPTFVGEITPQAPGYAFGGSEVNRLLYCDVIFDVVSTLADAGLPVVLVRTAGMPAAGYLGDGIHPNNTGYAYLASRFASAMAPASYIDRARINALSYVPGTNSVSTNTPTTNNPPVTAVIGVTPATLNFVGLTGAVQMASLTITNTGTAALDWSATGLSSPLSVSPSSGTVQPTESTTVTVTFNSASAGTWNQTLTFAGGGGAGITIAATSTNGVATGNHLLTGLVGWLPLDEASGSRVDTVSGQSFNEYPGIAVPSTVGVAGNAASFANNNNQVLTNAAQIYSDVFAGDFTLSAWVNFNSISSWQSLVAKAGYGYAAGSEFNLSFHSAGYFMGTLVATNGQSSAYSLTNAVTTGTWNFVSWRYNVSTKQMTMGIGTNYTTAVANRNVTSSLAWPLSIGGLGDRNLNMRANAKLDEIGIWSRVLSDAELAQIQTGVTKPQ